jgi:ATP-dependent RNA helicase DDX52/ROK1
LINIGSKAMSSYSGCVSRSRNSYQSISSPQNLQGTSGNNTKGRERRVLKEGELPPELDFFKYAVAGSSKRKPSGSSGEGHAVMKRHKKEETVGDWDANTEDEGNGDSDGGIANEPTTSSRTSRQRITIKGNNTPERADTFEELRDRYSIHSQLMENLKRNDYEHPTGIQSAGCPILLEVRSPTF